MSFVVDVSIPTLLQTEKKQLTLSYSNDDTNVTVHDIKTAVANDGNVELLSYVLYYRGNPVDDHTKISDLRVCSKNQNYLKVYLMENDVKIKEVCTPSSSVNSSTPATNTYMKSTPRSFSHITSTKKSNFSIPVDVDELSLASAKKWIDNNNSFDDNADKVIEVENSVQLLQEFHGRIHNSVTKSNAPAPRDNLLALNWFDWRILTRYVICFILFAQGSSYSRMATFLSVSILYFVVEMGLIALIMERLGHDDNNPNNNDEVNQNNLRGVGAAVGARPDRLVAGGGIGSLIASYIVDISRHGGRLPREPGILNDVYSFLMAFVFSLMPNWNVQT